MIHAEVAVGDDLPPIVHPVTTETVVRGATAARIANPVHLDPEVAQNRTGWKDIFVDQPTQAAWLERLVTEWSGGVGRLGRLRFAMRAPVFPGDTIEVAGCVTAVEVDEVGCGWVTLDLAITVDGALRTSGSARVALPASADDDPWTRTGADWRP